MKLHDIPVQNVGWDTVDYSPGFVLTPGRSYQVSNEAEPHRPSSPTGARLLIVD